jgi:hypothetical protein
MSIAGKILTVHRLAYALSIGVPEIPRTLHVTRTCDNDQCCRPSHLRVKNVATPETAAVADRLGLQKRCPRCGSEYRVYEYEGKSIMKCLTCKREKDKMRKREIASGRVTSQREPRRNGNAEYEGGPENTIEYQSMIARIRNEAVSAMFEPKVSTPPPANRKEAVMRRLLDEIEQMSKPRSDEDC